MLPAPPATSSSEDFADWMEVDAILRPDRATSLESLVGALRRNGSFDAMSSEGDDEDDEDRGGRFDRGSEVSQQLAEDAFSELEGRQQACGQAYPFHVTNGTIRLPEATANSNYIFLLLLSKSTPTTGHEGTAVLFEDMCVAATQGYLGGDGNRAQAFRFGAPRRPPHAQLHQALDDLCARLGEGGSCRDRNGARHMGDDGLDIVGWRQFPDTAGGKLVVFGQCAAGHSTPRGKPRELLDGEDFARKWLTDTIWVKPTKMYFVPMRVPANEMRSLSIEAGIVFDRCRIASCAMQSDAVLAARREKAIKSLLDRVSGAA